MNITLTHCVNDATAIPSANERYQQLLNQQASLGFKQELYTLLRRLFNSTYFQKLTVQTRRRLDKINTLVAAQSPQLADNEWVNNEEVLALVLEHLSPVDYEFIIDDF